MNRRGFIKTLFGMSVGVVTRPVGQIVEALTTRKTANQVLSIVTGTEILDAKMFIIPYIPLMKTVVVTERLHGEGRLT